MNPQDDELRNVLGSLGGTGFDHDALVAGTMERAGRIRRRRAISQALVAAIVVPGLLAAGWMAGQRLGADQDLSPAMSPSVSDSVPTSLSTDPEIVTEEVTGPPYQETAPPASVTPDTPNPEWPNRIDIPDARPSGIAFLDAFGAPQTESYYPRTSSLLLGPLAGTSMQLEAHSGAFWYYHDGTNDLGQQTAEIVLTAWDDSAAAMEEVRSLRGAGAQPWPGHEDDDHLAVVEPSFEGSYLGSAVVRRGDYVIAVHIQASTQEEALGVALEVAEKTVANLAHLDPEHAQG